MDLQTAVGAWANWGMGSVRGKAESTLYCSVCGEGCSGGVQGARGGLGCVIPGYQCATSSGGILKIISTVW